jgi:hypothetical protein
LLDFTRTNIWLQENKKGQMITIEYNLKKQDNIDDYIVLEKRKMKVGGHCSGDVS